MKFSAVRLVDVTSVIEELKDDAESTKPDKEPPEFNDEEASVSDDEEEVSDIAADSMMILHICRVREFQSEIHHQAVLQ